MKKNTEFNYEKNHHYLLKLENVAKDEEKELRLRFLLGKVVLNQQEKSEVIDYYRNSQRVDYHYFNLVDSQFVIEKSINVNRIKSVNFFVNGLKNLPLGMKDLLEEAITTFLVLEPEGSVDRDHLKLITADKLELISALQQYDAPYFQQFQQSYQTEQLKKLVDYVQHY